MVAIGVGAFAAGIDLNEERGLYVAADAATDQAVTLGQGGQIRRSGPAIPESASPRVNVYYAIRLARDASLQPEGSNSRGILLAAAEQAAAIGAAARPSWGEAEVVRSYVAELAGDTPQAVSSFSASYDSAPFIRNSAFWRMGFGVMHWDKLSPATQIQVIDEALWLRAIVPDRRDEINAFLRNSPAYPGFVLRSSAFRAQSPAPQKPSEHEQKSDHGWNLQRNIH